MLWQLFLLDAVVMTLCWLWATSNHRAGIVDVAWSFCIFLNTALTALFVEIAPLKVRLFIGIFSSIWFLRLSLHLFRVIWLNMRKIDDMPICVGRWENINI